MTVFEAFVPSVVFATTAKSFEKLVSPDASEVTAFEAAVVPRVIPSIIPSSVGVTALETAILPSPLVIITLSAVKSPVRTVDIAPAILATRLASTAAVLLETVLISVVREATLSVIAVCTDIHHI